MATSVSMAMPLTHKTALPAASGSTLFNPLTISSSSSSSSSSRVGSKRMMMVVQGSFKEKAVTAAALTASMVVPDVAEAASSVTPSLNNFLLSIGAGGAVLVAILGAIIGVSNFDPVKRG